MYNFEIENFGQFLIAMNIKGGKQSRMRTRFIKVLNERLSVIENERKELLEKHADKDEEGNPKYTIVNEELGQVEYIVSDKGLLGKEITELWNEEFVIDESEANRDLLTTVKNAVLEYEGELSGAEAAIYDRLCEIIENVYQE